jgi:hypothetical protein
VNNISNDTHPSGTEQLTIWNIDSGQRARAVVDAEDIGISWFPDGDSLVYVTPVGKDDVLASALDDLAGSNSTACREYTDHADIIPMVSVLDIRSGKTHLLHAGTNPVVSSDGRSVLLRCGGFMVMNLATDSVAPAKWPGDSQLNMVWLGHIQTPLAFLGGHIVVFWGLPTKGAPAIRNPLRGVNGGGQLVTIKVAAIGTDDFQTVVPAIDRRWPVSFGQPIAGFDSVADGHSFTKFFY